MDGQPARATLLDTSPVPPERLIPAAQLKARRLERAEFEKRAKHANALVIDVREPLNRKKADTIGLQATNVYAEQLMEMLRRGMGKDRTLLIFDAFGGMLPSLHYVLVANGYENFYFLKRGISRPAESD